MNELRQANDSLLAEIQSLKLDLNAERRRYKGTLKRLNKCLRNASDLQHERDKLKQKLEALRGLINE